jgi:hypothetical protein
MKSLQELVNINESSWKNLEAIILSASNDVAVLPKIEGQAATALYEAQLPVKSPIGALIYETGGLLVDHGWLRVLGSGNERLNRSLPAWNLGKSYRRFGDAPLFLLIADDVLGGFYAINAGGLAEQEGLGSVFYYAPDAGEWENMEIGYTDFIGFCCTGDIAGFYEDFREPGWQEKIAEVDSHSVLSGGEIISVEEAWTRAADAIDPHH